MAQINKEALNVLVESRKRFHAFVAKRVGSEEVAEDLLQNALRKAIERPTESTNHQSIVAWFYQILKNSLVDHYRSRASETKIFREFEIELEQANASTEIEAEVCACMKELLPTLKESYAELIRRVDLDQEPVEKVAAELKLSKNNLSVRLHRARQSLKASLERTCGICTKHGCLDCSCK